MTGIRKQVAACVATAFVLVGCSQTFTANHKAEELAVMAKSSFFQGEVTPAADPIVQATGDGGFIPDPNAGTGGGADHGVIAAPGPTIPAPAPSQPVTPPAPTDPVVPTTPVVVNPPAPTPVPTDPVVAPVPAPADPVSPTQPSNPSNPSTPIVNDPPTGDGGVIAGPGTGGGSDHGTVPPGTGGSTPGTNPTDPGTPPGGTVVNNPPSGGTPTDPIAPTNPSNPTDPANPSNPAPGDGGVVANPPTQPGTGDGGVVQNPPTNPGQSDGGTVPTNPTNPGTPSDPGGPVVTNPPTNPGTDPANPSNPGNPTNPNNPSNPSNPTGPVVTNPPGTGDGGQVPGPGTPGGGNDGGQIPPQPCTNPAICPAFNVTIARVCSERRSAMPFPQFVFFEETRNPILTFEAGVNACVDTSRNPSLASVGGGGQLHPMESHLINILFSPRADGKHQVVLAGKKLAPTALRDGKYRTRLTIALDTIRAWFPHSWKRIWVNAAVCDDRNNDGLCYGESTAYQMLTQSEGFRLGTVPRNVNLYVWHGRRNTLRHDPEMCETQISPLVLDLGGNGFHFSSAEDGVEFDLNDTGTPVLSGWTRTNDDAFLVRDINGNGRIDSGAELFGSATRLKDGSRAANGFKALAELDSNGNGLFDKGDKAWSEVRLWIDYRRDGESDSREFFTLERAGVESIALNYLDAQEIDAYGNETRQRSTFTRNVNGRRSVRQVIDIWFNTLTIE